MLSCGAFRWIDNSRQRGHFRAARYPTVTSYDTVSALAGSRRAAIAAHDRWYNGESALEQKDGEDAARRPITFVFNGSPGSSAVWLHMMGLARGGWR
jgi:carboxypeptidase C (cathepsin A)